MQAGEVIEAFRRRVFDTVKPYLWDDDDALEYINQAYVNWVRLTGGIRDSQGELCSATVAADSTFFELDERILKVVSARRVVDGRTLFMYGPNSEEARLKPTSGQLVGFIEGEDTTGVRPIYIPDVDYEITMVIDRLPLAAIKDEKTELELREDQSLKLVYGMMGMAFMKDDVETRDTSKADAYTALFENDARRAYLEKRRRGGSSRTVLYGGY